MRCAYHRRASGSHLHTHIYKRVRTVRYIRLPRACVAAVLAVLRRHHGEGERKREGNQESGSLLSLALMLLLLTSCWRALAAA